MHLKLCVFLVILITVRSDDGDDADSNGFCTKNEDGVECVNSDEMKLTRLSGVEVGHTKSINVDGRELHLKTSNLKPLVFEIEDFLTSEECDHFISVAKDVGLKSSHTERNKPQGNFILIDLNKDSQLSIEEMKITIENGYDMYLDDDDIQEMYTSLKIDPNHDNFITMEEMNGVSPAKFSLYLKEFIKKNPEKHSRYSKQAWLYPDSSGDTIFKHVQQRVSDVVQLPMSLISLSDFQVVNYGVKGHYNAHLDSGKVDPQVPCCDRGRVRNCRICRFMTVLFYLNDVEGGGETAFPVANNETIGDYLDQRKMVGNLYKGCSDANLRISAQKGKAVLWYNHFIDPTTGWMGDIDEFTLHGGCPVTSGQKWIANFWIKTTNDKSYDMKRMQKK